MMAVYPTYPPLFALRRGVLGQIIETEPESKRYDESEQAFCKALAMRQKLFGSQSEKVGETLLGYSQLLQDEGKSKEAQTMQSQADSIRTSLTNKNKTDTVTPIVVSCIFIISCSQKDRLLILLAGRTKKVYKAGRAHFGSAIVFAYNVFAHHTNGGC